MANRILLRHGQRGWRVFKGLEVCFFLLLNFWLEKWKKMFQRIQLLVVQTSIHCLFWGDACEFFFRQTNKKKQRTTWLNIPTSWVVALHQVIHWCLLGSGMGMFMIDEQSPSYPREKTFNILEGLSLSLQSSPTSPATKSRCVQIPLNKVRKRFTTDVWTTRNLYSKCFDEMFFESHHSWSFQYCTADSCSDFRLCNVSCDQQERRGGFSTFGVYRFEHCKCPVSIDSRPKGAFVCFASTIKSGTSHGTYQWNRWTCDLAWFKELLCLESCWSTCDSLSWLCALVYGRLLSGFIRGYYETMYGFQMPRCVVEHGIHAFMRWSGVRLRDLRTMSQFHKHPTLTREAEMFGENLKYRSVLYIIASRDAIGSKPKVSNCTAKMLHLLHWFGCMMYGDYGHQEQYWLRKQHMRVCSCCFGSKAQS